MRDVATYEEEACSALQLREAYIGIKALVQDGQGRMDRLSGQTDKFFSDLIMRVAAGVNKI